MPQPPENKEKFNQAIYWASSAKIVIGLIIILVFIILYYSGSIDFSIKPIILYLMPILLGTNGLLLWAGKRQKLHSSIIIYPQAVISIIIISVIVAQTGENHGEFLFLYIIPLITASLFSTGFTIFTISLILAFYLLIHIFTFGLAFAKTLEELNHVVILIFLAAITTFQSRYYLYELKKSDKEVMKIKDDFLFQTVHDLRSPAVAIKWLMKKYTDPEFKSRYPEIQNDIGSVKELATRINSLSENLLTVAKGQRIEIKKYPTDISTVINRIMIEIGPGVAEKNIESHYEPLQNMPMIMANAELLEEAFINILNNAVKYNNQNGKLKIWHSIENGFLKTMILNTGPAISPENINKLFTPYFRGDKEDKVKGTGLGLYVTRKIVEQIGGTTGVQSSSEENTVFYISLPIMK